MDVYRGSMNLGDRKEIENRSKMRDSYRVAANNFLMTRYVKIGQIQIGPPNGAQTNFINSIDIDSEGRHIVSGTQDGKIIFNAFTSNDECYLSSNDTCTHTYEPINATYWHPGRENQIVCASRADNVRVFDAEVRKCIGTYVTTKQAHIDRGGFTDVGFSHQDISRLFASERANSVCLWDVRVGPYPCILLQTLFNNNRMNCIRVHGNDQTIIGGGTSGNIFLWDLRGKAQQQVVEGESVNTMLPSEEFNLKNSIRLCMGNNTKGLSILSIDFDPTCQDTLSFCCDNGWSGIWDFARKRLTHLHQSLDIDYLYLSRPAWFQRNSVCVLGESTGINMLNFTRDFDFPCRYPDKPYYMANKVKMIDSGDRGHRVVPLDLAIRACAVHPINDVIVAGTKEQSLVVLSQRGDDED